MESVNYFQSDTILLSRVKEFANLRICPSYPMLVRFMLFSNGLVNKKNMIGIYMLNITEVLTDWIPSSCILTYILSDI